MGAVVIIKCLSLLAQLTDNIVKDICNGSRLKVFSLTACTNAQLYFFLVKENANLALSLYHAEGSFTYYVIAEGGF